MKMTVIPIVHRPTGTVHRAIKASGAPRKGLRTLCDIPVDDDCMVTAPFAVGANRPTIGAIVPADPFFSDRGCTDCMDGMSY